MTDYTAEQIDAAVAAAAQAFTSWSASSAEIRAAFLRGLADALEQHRETLVPLGDRETSLGAGRLNGELDRTTFQLRRFADIAASGQPFAFIDDPAVVGAPPAGHPAMMQVRVPLGPVAMFAASNFPFAFSVLGGDTASALAAGCTVVVKAHQGHPELSRTVYALIREVMASQGLEGVITFVEGGGNAVGQYLVQHPQIAAAAFTGSTRGGLALQALANARPRPIPFYGELGAVNPVVALPHALQAGGAELAQTLAGSITLGCGQFCTNPGTLVVLDDPATDSFLEQLHSALRELHPHAMLTGGMRSAFESGIARQQQAGADVLLHNEPAGQAPGAFLASIGAAEYISKPELQEEVFGPSSLIVRCADPAEVLAVLAAIGGSLTVTVWGAEHADAATRLLVRQAMQIAGRVLFKGVPTGVAVTAAQLHGGPFPASTAPMTTSVGDAALNRFLRPVALQDAPAWLVALQGRPVSA